MTNDSMKPQAKVSPASVLYPIQLFVRTVNPGTDDEFQISGSSPSDVADSVVGDSDTIAPIAARYLLAGVGNVVEGEALYLETTSA